MKRTVTCMLLAMCISLCEAQTVGAFNIGYRYGDPAPYGFHPGIDFVVNSGTPIIAATDGRVILLRKTAADGDEVVIVHGMHFISNYAHLSKTIVEKDQFVKRGQLIGFSGASNNYGRPNYQHLHFGICIIGQRGCREQSQTHNPDLFWLAGQPQCFDPKTNYSAYSQKDITLPIGCGDYAKVLIEQSKGK